MQATSILAQELIERLLATARQNLENDGVLIPALLVNVERQAPILMPLALPAAVEARQAYLAAIGAQLRRAGYAIREAVMLLESWIVAAPKAPRAFHFLPSQHPCRQEAIVIVGRNAPHTRKTQVIQPFERDAANQPVWNLPLLAVFNQPLEAEPTPYISLLDRLFPLTYWEV